MLLPFATTLLCAVAVLIPPALSQAVSVAVVVSDDAAAAPMPPNASFIGFSGIEASLDVLSARLVGGGYAPRASYVRLMTLLGPGVNHRLGHFWASASGDRPAGVPSLWLQANTSVCGRLAAALDAFSGSLTANIGPVDRADASLVVDTAQALITGSLRNRILSLELANEPDISSFAGNYSGYVATLRMWLAGLAASGGGLPQRLVDAPVLAGTTWWPQMPAFLAEFAPALEAFTQHRYALSACGNRSNTPAELMNASTTWSTAADEALLGALAAARLPFVLGEGNSVSCQGSAGVSDVFASALYAVEAMLNAAAVNCTGYKWHGLAYAIDAAFYQPIFYDTAQLQTPGWDVAQPRPLFLGLWAAAEAAPPGSTLLRAAVTAEGAPSRLLPAWALRSADGRSVTVTLLHKDATAAPALVTVTPAAPCADGAQATVARLLGGGNLSAKSGCSYRGLTFDGTSDGTPAGVPSHERVPCRSGTFSFSLPAASGAFLTYESDSSQRSAIF